MEKSQEKTLEELRKRINGKRVVHVDQRAPGFKLNAIFIAPPGGDVLALHPYGYTVEEVWELHKGYGGFSEELSYYQREDFCCATHPIESDSKHIEMLQRIADIPEGGEYDFLTIIEGLEYNQGLNAPSCPYGGKS